MCRITVDKSRKIWQRVITGISILPLLLTAGNNIALPNSITSEPGSGDVNDDGALDVLDIVATVSYIMGSQEFTEEQQLAADMNFDGSVDVLDIVRMVEQILNPQPQNGMYFRTIKLFNGLKEPRSGLEAELELVNGELYTGISSINGYVSIELPEGTNLIGATLTIDDPEGNIQEGTGNFYAMELTIDEEYNQWENTGYDELTPEDLTNGSLELMTIDEPFNQEYWSNRFWSNIMQAFGYLHGNRGPNFEHDHYIAKQGTPDFGQRDTTLIYSPPFESYPNLPEYNLDYYPIFLNAINIVTSFIDSLATPGIPKTIAIAENEESANHVVDYSDWFSNTNIIVDLGELNGWYAPFVISGTAFVKKNYGQSMIEDATRAMQKVVIARSINAYANSSPYLIQYERDIMSGGNHLVPHDIAGTYVALNLDWPHLRFIKDYESVLEVVLPEGYSEPETNDNLKIQYVPK